MLEQRGFTLIEILVAMAIGGLIMPVVVSAIFQVSTSTARVNTDFVILADIDAASSWFNRDLAQANTTDVLDGAPAVNTMRVDWTDQTGWATEGQEAHYVNYYIESGTTLLKRDYDGTVSTVARRIADIQFSRSGTFITVTITSSLGGQAETLSYFVTPRADGALQ